MDGFNWDGADVAVNTSASWGSNPQESLMMQNSGGFTFVGGKVVHPEDIFTSIQLLQKTGYSSHCNSIMSDRIISHLIQHSAPASDPTQVNIPSWSFSQQEQPFKLADDDNVPRQSSGAEISPPSKLKSTGFINQLNGLFSDYGMENKSMIDDCLQEAKAGLIAAATGSTESIDCLLSASDSIHTETSIEDDADISMLFSDCKSLWNFNALNAGSSGESACASSNAKDRKNHNHMNELDETASPTSSGHQIANQAKSSGGITGHKAIKRSSETLLKNLVDQSDTSNIAEASFQLISENQPKPKKPRSEKRPTSSNINFQQPSSSSISSGSGEPDSEAIAQMKEMIYRAAAFRPVNFGTEIMEKPKRKNVRISTDPQTVAARQRRERISERIRVLQRLVPGGSKMDTASMLDEAANYLKFLRSQVKALEAMGPKLDDCPSIPFNHSFPMASNFSTQNPNYVYHPKI